MIFQDNQTITRTRRCTLQPDGTVDVEDGVADTFRGRVYPPSQSKKGPSDDNSPRGYTPEQPMWVRPGLVNPTISAGDRFEADGVAYEAVSAQHGKRAALQVLVTETTLKPVTGLYPVLAQLRELGGEVVKTVPVATWTSNKTVANHGYYEDLAGEAPVEYFADLNVKNRELYFGGRALRLSRVLLMTAQPHVRFSLKGLG